MEYERSLELEHFLLFIVSLSFCILCYISAQVKSVSCYHSIIQFDFKVDIKFSAAICVFIYFEQEIIFIENWHNCFGAQVNKFGGVDLHPFGAALYRMAVSVQRNHLLWYKFRSC